MEEEKAEPIELDAEKVNELLDVLTRTKDDTSLMPLAQVARINLAIMAHELQKQLEERAEEAKKKAEADSAKKEAEAKQPQETEYARRA